MVKEKYHWFPLGDDNFIAIADMMGGRCYIKVLLRDFDRTLCLSNLGWKIMDYDAINSSDWFGSEIEAMNFLEKFVNPSEEEW